MRIASRAFREHLSLQFFRSEGQAPFSQTLASALLTIEAKARFDGGRKDVHVRVAEHDGEIWLDLCNDLCEAVRITSRGWEVVPDPYVKFVCPPGIMPLPRPAREGSLLHLESFTTLPGDALTLLKGYLLGSLRQQGPFPILALIGEQGSGKTTLSRLVKRMIDPSKAAIRCLPRDERDLMIAAEAQHVLAMDNLSFIDEQMSDALCRLATGGGLSTRTLYTDRDQTIFEAQKPVILNAITDVVGRPDLLDRAIVLSVPPLEESSRRPEREFWADFEKAHPSMLGALCDAASRALRDTKTQSVPSVRMVDFALFVSRGEKGLGLKQESFIRAYEGNRREANETAMDFSSVAQALRQFFDEKREWSGTAGELLELLNPLASDDTRRSKEWPKTPRGLSSSLRRLVPSLRPIGICINMDNREAGTGRRLIEIKRRREEPSRPSRLEVTVTREHIENEADTQTRDSCDDTSPCVTVAQADAAPRIFFAEDGEVTL
jgi:energy-coupling factor transporter ATP-binding protein EcfA2